MIFKECSHPPHAVRITFDVGNDKTSTYHLCSNCKEHHVFQDFVLAKEILN